VSRWLNSSEHHRVNLSERQRLESLAPRSLAPLVAWLRSIGWIVLWGLVLAGVLSYVLLPGIIFAMLLNLVVGLMTGWA